MSAFSKRNEDNKSYPLIDNKSNQSNKPSQLPLRPPPYSSKKETEIKDKPTTASSAYSSKPQEKETDIKDTKSNQSIKPSEPPSQPPLYSSKPQEKETEIRDAKSSQLNKHPQPPSWPPPYSSNLQKKETEIKDKSITASSTDSSEPQEKEIEIKDTPVTTSSADSSSEVPTYAVLDWQKKVKPVTEPSPLSDTVIYTTIVKK